LLLICNKSMFGSLQLRVTHTHSAKGMICLVLHKHKHAVTIIWQTDNHLWDLVLLLSVRWISKAWNTRRDEDVQCVFIRDDRPGSAVCLQFRKTNANCHAALNHQLLQDVCVCVCVYLWLRLKVKMHFKGSSCFHYSSTLYKCGGNTDIPALKHWNMWSGFSGSRHKHTHSSNAPLVNA